MSNKYTKGVCFIVQDKNGHPLIGTKICATKSGAQNSMAPHINGIIMHKIGWTGILSEIYSTANKGYAIAKPVHDSAIDDFVDHMRTKSTYTHKNGNLNVTRQAVEEYNQIVNDIIDNWQVKRLVSK